MLDLHCISFSINMQISDVLATVFNFLLENRFNSLACYRNGNSLNRKTRLSMSFDSCYKKVNIMQQNDSTELIFSTNRTKEMLKHLFNAETTQKNSFENLSYFLFFLLSPCGRWAAEKHKNKSFRMESPSYVYNGARLNEIVYFSQRIVHHHTQSHTVVSLALCSLYSK